MQVVGPCRILRRFEAELVTGTVTRTALDSTPGHPGRKDSGVMITTLLLALHKRLTAKFTGANNQS